MTYPGGKGRVYQRVISLMPPHRVYIETHLGHGTILRRKRPATESFGVDMDPAVVARWRSGGVAGCTVIQGDAIDFLMSFRYSGDELVYCDPPYLPETRRQRRVYKHDYEASDHIALLRVLGRLPCFVMLSGYPSNLYDRTLQGWRRIEFASPTQAGSRAEAIWMNFEPPSILHDHSFLGADFRAREQVRRRRTRLMERIMRLRLEERHALIAEIVEAEGPTVSALLARAQSTVAPGATANRGA